MSRREKLHQAQKFANLLKKSVSKFDADQIISIKDTAHLVEVEFFGFFEISQDIMEVLKICKQYLTK